MKIKVLESDRGYEAMMSNDFVLRMESSDISLIQLHSNRMLKSFPLVISVDGVVYNFLHLERNQDYFRVAVYKRSSDFDEREISPSEISEMILKYIGKEVTSQNRNSIHYMLSALRSIK